MLPALDIRFRYRSLAWLTPLILMLAACSSSVPQLDGVDWDIWQSDKSGCSYKRTAFADTLDFQKEVLLTHTEVEIIRLLGRPDQNELFARNQKFYTYFFDPGPDCSTPSSDAKKLIIRFNAIGIAQNVEVRTGSVL